MATRVSDSKRLHLPDLVVRGFRGIEDIEVSQLGQVNLISGKNSVGKTTLLDAIRVYAARGHYSVLSDILRTREELITTIDEDGDEVLAPDWNALFSGRGPLLDTSISIGTIDESLQLSIKVAPMSEGAFAQQSMFSQETFIDSDEDLLSLKVKIKNSAQEIPINILNTLPFRSPRQRRFRLSDESELPPRILSETLGPGLLSNGDVARFWYNVALTDDESRAVDALNLIFDDIVERIAVIGDDGTSRVPYGRQRAVAKIRGEGRPVPLKSLGDGAVRLFGVALALANSKDGFLLIDEVENGIHYSLQFDFWKMVMRTAYENNVQVFATTHSWDCVRGFAWAAYETEEVEGRLVRLQRKNGRVRVVEYNEDDLKVVSEQGIEVR